MVATGNKVKRYSSVNYTIKTIHHQREIELDFITNCLTNNSRKLSYFSNSIPAKVIIKINLSLVS